MPTEPAPSLLKRLRSLLPLGGLGLFAVLPWVSLRNDSVRHALLALLSWFQHAGMLGRAAFVLWAFFEGLFALPIVLSSAMAGFVWGFPGGYPVSLAALATYALGGWVTGRTFRGFARRRLLSTKYGPAILKAMGRRDFKLIALMRMTPLFPQNLLGITLAATPARVQAYLLATVLGLAPITALHTWVGSQLQSAEALVQGEAGPRDPGTRRMVTAAVALASVVGLFLVSRVARRSFDEVLREEAQTKD